MEHRYYTPFLPATLIFDKRNIIEKPVSTATMNVMTFHEKMTFYGSYLFRIL